MLTFLAMELVANSERRTEEEEMFITAEIDLFSANV